jgi:chromosome segregation ATPase
MLESQLSAAQRGKEEKLEENKHIREEIAKLEEENKTLEEETHRLDEEIGKLDEEFKQAQLDAGRLRREIKVNTERGENEKKQSAKLRIEISRVEKELEDLRRKVKQEIDGRRSLEQRLRKTNSQIDAMKEHWASGFVTRKLEKQDWYLRQEEPVVEYEGEEEAVAEPALVSAEEAVVEAEAKEKTKDDEDGIDFSVD